jgi:hypothetical protein
MALGVVLGLGAGVAIGSKLNLGVSTSLKNVENKAKEGISDVSEAVNSSTNPILAKIKSAFPSKDIGSKGKPSEKGKAQPASKPKEIKTQNLKPLEALSYFPTAMKYYIKFGIYDKVSETVLAPRVKKNIVDIYLPMPTNLVDSTELTYDTASIGPLGGAGLQAIEGSQQLAQQLVRENSFSGVVNTLRNELDIKNLAKRFVDLAAAQTLRSTGETVTGSLLRQTLRTAPNPFIATVFSNVNLRAHQFSYKFSPRSEDELYQLKEIIYNFRRAALPSSKNVGFSEGSYLLSFPYEVEIQFYPNEVVPYFFKPCVITSIVVNYAPDGSPAFFKTGDPVAVEFQINLQELEVITREELEKKVEVGFGRPRSLGLIDASGQSTTLL